MNIIVGISWPFANGELHIGHAASSLPGDVIARFHRLRGDKVILISGTDCHGTPTEVKALQENKTPQELVNECHVSFAKDFKDFGISFDLYNRTDDPYHKDFVSEQFVKYYNNGYLEEKEEEQLYCDHCKLFLADRYVIGICPKCGAEIKGDECEKCRSLFTIDQIEKARCAICGNITSYKKNKNLYFKLSKFQKDIEKFLASKRNLWRENAVNFTERYLKEGIPDRCASRTLSYGIDIPIEGFKDKKLYGWFENVWGYVTASKKYAELNNLNWEDFWKGNDSKIYLVHAKDNIPFHTVIFPSLLLATGDNYRLPDKIISDEYITIEGEKLSKSKGNYITLRHLLDNYPVDAIRYYFSINNPETRDFNFTYEGFINSINGELLGKWGNFVNRTLQFINKSFDGKLSNTSIDLEIESKLKELYDVVGTDIDNGDTKAGLSKIFDFINYANKYFDENKPWNLVEDNKDKCEEILYNCCNIIFNINNLLKPYLIETTKTVEGYLNSSASNWKYERLKAINLAEEIKPLFVRYDKKVIIEEKANL